MRHWLSIIYIHQLNRGQFFEIASFIKIYYTPPSCIINEQEIVEPKVIDYPVHALDYFN